MLRAQASFLAKWVASYDGMEPRTPEVGKASPADAATRRRAQQCIICGGRVVSPFEIEQALESHHAVQHLLAFPVQHSTLGQVVGLAIVPKLGHRRPTLAELRSTWGRSLPAVWLPRRLVFMQSIPQGATRKQAELAERLDLPTMQPSSDPDTWEVRGAMAHGETGRIPAVRVAGVENSDLALRRSGPAPGALLATVTDAVQRMTGQDNLKPTTPLMDAGVDSLSATRLVIHLEELTSLQLSPTLVFQLNTAEAIASHLEEGLAGPKSGAAHVNLVSARVHNVGGLLGVQLGSMAARWPHGASSQGALDRLCNTGFDAVSEVPVARWIVANADSSRYPAARHVAFLPGVDLFDNALFGVSPAEAAWMDPQQRLLLEEGYAAFHLGGRSRQQLLDCDVGVSVGIQATDFERIVLRSDTVHLPVYAASGFTFSVAAGRLSFALGMQGPCHNTETACSTALVAMHTGVAMLTSDGCEGVVVLAVNVMPASPVAHAPCYHWDDLGRRAVQIPGLPRERLRAQRGDGGADSPVDARRVHGVHRTARQCSSFGWPERQFDRAQRQRHRCACCVLRCVGCHQHPYARRNATGREHHSATQLS